MSPSEFYQARRIKRNRGTKLEIEARRYALYQIVSLGRPMTVRQVFYQAAVRNIVEKTERGYSKVQTDLTVMRREGELPYGWLADNTRWQRKPTSYSGVDDLLQSVARFYRRDLWIDADCYVEIWCEKDALAGVMLPVTAEYDVPLMVARGYSSLSFLHEAGECLADLEVPAFIYHFGDYDPSGQDAARDIEKKLRDFAPEAEINFERVAVTSAQISAWHLPTRPTKASDPRAKKFGDISVELDAVEPNRLRTLVRNAIEAHVEQKQLEILRTAEKSERELIAGLGGKL
jgi:hypothetical protein